MFQNCTIFCALQVSYQGQRVGVETSAKEEVGEAVVVHSEQGGLTEKISSIILSINNIFRQRSL